MRRIIIGDPYSLIGRSAFIANSAAGSRVTEPLMTSNSSSPIQSLASSDQHDRLRAGRESSQRKEVHDGEPKSFDNNSQPPSVSSASSRESATESADLLRPPGKVGSLAPSGGDLQPRGVVQESHPAPGPYDDLTTAAVASELPMLSDESHDLNGRSPPTIRMKRSSVEGITNCY